MSKSTQNDVHYGFFCSRVGEGVWKKLKKGYREELIAVYKPV